MKKLVTCALLASVVTLGGCKDDVFEPEPYISNVSPDFVVQGRSKQVTISGVVTEWSTESTPFADAITVDNVSFGEGVTVESIEVLNHGTLRVDIVADSTATFGPRDVEVAGDVFPGVFRVTPPFEVLDMSVPAPGRFFQALIQGYDTLWVQDSTQVDMGDMVHFGPETADGSGPLYGIFDGQGVIGAQVLGTDLVLVTGWVDAFAVPGESLDLTITNYDGSEETATGLVEIVDPGVLTDTGGPQVIEEPFENILVDPTIPADRSAKLAVSSPGAGFLMVFDPAVSGLTPINPGPFYGDETGVGTYGSLESGMRVNGLRYVYMDLYYSLGPLYEALPANLQLVDPATYPPGVTHNIILENSPMLTEASPATGEQIVYDTQNVQVDPNWYDLGLTAPAILEATVQPTAGSPTINGTVNFFSPSAVMEPYSYDNELGGVTEVASGLAGPMVALGIGDAAGSTGAATEYTVSYTTTAIPGQYFGSGALFQPFGSSGNIQSSVNVSTGGATVNNVHVFVNIGHTWQSDVRLTLEAPDGTSLQLCSGSCRPGASGSADGILELYGDPNSTVATDTVTDLDATFAGIAADGTWTLHVDDTFSALDDGELVNWGVSIN